MKTCPVEDDLVRELATLSDQLNTLRPVWVKSEKARRDTGKERSAASRDQAPSSEGARREAMSRILFGDGPPPFPRGGKSKRDN